MIEIEQCKTWVSDRTLANIAKALNMEVYELLIPAKDESKRKVGKKDNAIGQMVKHIKLKKNQLQKNIQHPEVYNAKPRRAWGLFHHRI